MIRRWAPLNLAIIGAALLAVTAAAGWTVLEEQAPAPVPAAAVESTEPAAPKGYQVFLDANGKRTDRPAPGAHNHADKTVEVGPLKKELMKNGGYKVDLSHVRAYQHATLDESGKVITNCETTHGAAK